MIQVEVTRDNSRHIAPTSGRQSVFQKQILEAFTSAIFKSRFPSPIIFLCALINDYTEEMHQHWNRFTIICNIVYDGIPAA